MTESRIQNPKSKIYLGIDGGQSHTEAVIGDENGHILGRGFGGASNHAEQPGGRERLHKAIHESVSEALKSAGLATLSEVVFASAHCGMTGGADYKEEIIRTVLQAETLVVGHDAPTALFGATSGKPGVVVIAGTGSAIFGINEAGTMARAGGLGFLFADEGSGFWLAAQAIRLAIKEQDGVIAPDGLERLVLEFFGRETIRHLTTDFYNGRVSRDEIAALARAAHDAALNGNKTLLNQIEYGCWSLVENVKAVAVRLQFTDKFPVAGVGGMFRGKLVRKFFEECLTENLPNAAFTEPRFNPGIGALLAAYAQAGVKLTGELLTNLEKISK